MKDLKIEEILPITIEDIIIRISNERRELGLPYGFNGDRLKTWKRRSGGILYKDLFHYLKGEDSGKYIQAEGGNILLILRLIEDEELEDFESKKLIHGKIKDKPFMLLRNLSEIEEKNNDDGYIDESNQEDDENETNSMIINNPNIPPEEEEGAGSGRSISLFD